MLVEALFWFHPIIWIIRSRLMKERELACDEEVLQANFKPEHYAEGILAVCRYYLKSTASCVSGVTGADLKQRVETIMLNHAPRRLDVPRRLLLTTAALGAVVGPVILGVMHVPAIVAQEPDKPVPQLIATNQLPEFEVASIRPSGRTSNLKVNFAPGGKLFITDATLRFLIKIAYDIGDDQLVGGPGWVGSKRFDVSAIPDIPVGGDPANMAPDQVLLFHKPTRLRLQRLLADRFQLELRREPRVMPIFALVVAKGGPKNLLVSDVASPQLNANAGAGLLNASGVDMLTLAKFLSEGQTGRPVVDMTGLGGKYNFRLEWSPDNGYAPTGNGPSQQPTDNAGGISVFTALQQQLGLKLEARTSPADRLVVVRAELPSPN